MRRAALITGLGSVSIILLALCGCSSSRYWKEWFPPKVNTLPNSVAIDRALRLCSLTEGEQPFHVILEVSPPAHAPAMRAEIEIYWLNRITYRTLIRSASFQQVRIVNGGVIEEHDTGDFYPRWIGNFVDAVLAPIAEATTLRKVPGTVPIEPLSQACITSPPGEPGTASMAQVCLAGTEPKIISGRDGDRYVSFDSFEPFGDQQIARTLVNDLPDNTLVRARVVLLEPLAHSDYRLLKAMEFTLPEKQIETTLVTGSAAQSMLELSANARSNLHIPSAGSGQPDTPMLVYIRTDRTGKVREAYFDNSGHASLPGSLADAAVARALMLKFKPLVVHGAAQQMEATIPLPGY